MIRLRYGYLEKVVARSLVRPYLVRLQRFSHETIVFTLWDGVRAIYIDKIESEHNLRTHARVGTGAFPDWNQYTGRYRSILAT